MEEQIYKEGDYLVIKIPLKQDRWCPFTEKKLGEMEAIAGLSLKNKNGNTEFGFVNRIDRSYKGKDDDISDFFYKYFGLEEDFEKLCKELGFDIFYLDFSEEGSSYFPCQFR